MILKPIIMKKQTTIILFMFLVGLVGAQEAFQQAVSSGGGGFSNEDVSLNWTIGESVIQTFSADGIVLTQGFQQSSYTITQIELNTSFNLIFNVYPNPTSQYVNIEVIGDLSDLEGTLYDLSGRIIVQKRFEENRLRFDLVDCSASTYMIIVKNAKGEKVANYKIIKNQ